VVTLRFPLSLIELDVSLAYKNIFLKTDAVALFTRGAREVTSGGKMHAWI